MQLAWFDVILCFVIFSFMSLFETGNFTTILQSKTSYTRYATDLFVKLEVFTSLTEMQVNTLHRLTSSSLAHRASKPECSCSNLSAAIKQTAIELADFSFYVIEENIPV